MVRKRIRRIKERIRRRKDIIEKIANNPIVVGSVIGVIKNIAEGKPAINLDDIVSRCTKINAKNPLLYLGGGYLLRNKLIQAIGGFLLTDPPNEEDIKVQVSEPTIIYLNDENNDNVPVTYIPAETNTKPKISGRTL